MTKRLAIILFAGGTVILGLGLLVSTWFASSTQLGPFIYALDGGSPAPASRSAPAAISAPPKPAAAVATQAGQTSPADSGQRLIVRTATVTLVVDDIATAVGQARSLAESYGDGFVVSSVQREEAGRPAATVTIRVPAESFDLAMDRLHGLAIRVSGEQVTSKDVTEEFIDTDARLRNFKATEARYVDLLARAATVDDILKVDQQLTAVRGQIEQLQGRAQFLLRSATTAAITIELRLPGAATTSAEWNALAVLHNAWSAFLGLVRVMLSALIWLGVFSPVWLVPLLVGVWLRRRRAAAV